jgi:hypothetical protein
VRRAAGKGAAATPRGPFGARRGPRATAGYSPPCDRMFGAGSACAAAISLCRKGPRRHGSRHRGSAPARSGGRIEGNERPSGAPRRSPRTLRSDGRHSPHCPWMEFQEGRTCRSPPLQSGALCAQLLAQRVSRVSRELEPLTSELSKARSILATVRRALCSWEVREVCSDPGGESSAIWAMNPSKPSLLVQPQSRSRLAGELSNRPHA